MLFKSRHAKWLSTTMLSVFTFFVLLIFCIISCRRDVKDIPDKQPGKQPDPASIPKGLAKLINEKGHSFYVEYNRSVPAFLIDKNGNEIERRPSGNRGLSTPGAICDDPASAEVYATFAGAENTVSDCINQTHTIVVHWQIKSSFDLALANPSPSYQASRGRLRIKNGSTTTYSDLNINLVSGNIVYVGTDPLNSALKIYNVTYTKTGIPHTYLAQGNFTVVESSLSVYSDCADPYDPYLIITSYTNIFAPQVGLDVCERNDLVYINPNTPGDPPPSNDMCASMAGSWVVTSPGACQNYTYNLGSELWVKKTGDPDNNYVHLQVKAAGDPSWRTDGNVFYWEVLWLRDLHTYVPNAPSSGSHPASYTFRWRNFAGTYGPPVSKSCSTPYYYTPLTLTIYDF